MFAIYLLPYFISKRKRKDLCLEESQWYCSHMQPSAHPGQCLTTNKGQYIRSAGDRRGEEGSYCGSSDKGGRRYMNVLVPLGALRGKSHLCIFFWKLRGLSPNFHIHVTVSDLYIYSQDRSLIGPHISLQQNRQTDPGNI
jgi:hypothetical protein